MTRAPVAGKHEPVGPAQARTDWNAPDVYAAWKARFVRSEPTRLRGHPWLDERPSDTEATP